MKTCIIIAALLALPSYAENTRQQAANPSPPTTVFPAASQDLISEILENYQIQEWQSLKAAALIPENRKAYEARAQAFADARKIIEIIGRERTVAVPPKAEPPKPKPIRRTINGRIPFSKKSACNLGTR